MFWAIGAGLLLFFVSWSKVRWCFSATVCPSCNFLLIDDLQCLMTFHFAKQLQHILRFSTCFFVFAKAFIRKVLHDGSLWASEHIQHFSGFTLGCFVFRNFLTECYVTYRIEILMNCYLSPTFQTNLFINVLSKF